MQIGSNVNAEFLFNLKRGGPKPAVEWCINVGLIASAYKCCRCGRRMKLSERKDVADGFEWRCRSYGVNGHEVKRAIRKGSLFSESRLSIADILLITYYWINRLYSKFIIQDLKLNGDQVVDWMNFCREICLESCINKSCVLGGVGVTVELHQSKIGKRKLNLRKSDTVRWVLSGIERGTNKMFVSIVDEINRNVITDEIKTYILPGTIIESDCWQMYNCYDDDEFQQFVASQSLYLTDPELSVHDAADKSWGIIGSHDLDSLCLDGAKCYLGEVMWRRSHCNKETLECFLDALVKVFPPRKED